MHKLSIAVLLARTCLGLPRSEKVGHDPNSMLNVNQLATERGDWRTPSPAKVDPIVTLDFDDIITTDGQAAIGLYNGLLFEGLTVVNASGSSVLDEEDRDCATSYPNTLVSSTTHDTKIPLIKIGTAKSNDDRPLALFDIVSFSIKPRLKRSSDPVILEYTFWRYTDAARWIEVFFGSGHRPVADSNWEGYNLTGLFALEISVWENRKQDFDFCLDDLRVRFHNTTESEAAG